MFDIGLGWQEMVVIALVAILVIGPKDLPGVLRSVGKWTRKARSLAGEFQSGLDDMLREAELDEAKKTFDTAKNFNINKTLEDTVDPTGEVKQEADSLRKAAQDEPAAKSKSKKSESKAKTTSKAPKDDAAKPSQGNEAIEEAAEGDDAPKARFIHHPAQIAPAHSIAPPAEPAEAEVEVAEGGKSSRTRA